MDTKCRGSSVLLKINLNLASRQTSKDDPNVLCNGLLPQVTYEHRRSGYIALGNASKHPGTPF